MKRLMILGLFLVMGVVVWANNRGVPRQDVADRFFTADSRYKVRVTTTTSVGDATFCVSTMTAVNLSTTSAYGGTFTPSLSASTATTYGGRAYSVWQVYGSSSNVVVDLSSQDISTVTSQYLTSGQWWSPDDPMAWQGEICFKSVSTFSVTGFLYFDKPR